VLSRLMKLDLKGCFALKSLPNSIGQLQSLEMINLCQCVNLATLPDSISNLSKLREIVLDYCTKLKELPMGFGNLQNLLLFSASGTSLSYLPDCFAQLFNLEELWLNNCTTFQELPSSIGGLWKLKVLGMNMTHVKKLPNDFGQLKSLKRLYLNGCKHLKTLSKSLGCLEKLEYLSMQTNLSLRLLPQSFGGLKTLQTLDLSQCSIGEGGVPDSFGALAKLKTLSLSGNLISTLPENFKDLNALINLHMSHCPNLVVVQTLPQNLEYLDLGGCHKLTNIPCLGDLSSLKYLGLNDCTRLTNLQGLNLLTTLVEVNISGCKMLCNTPGLNHNKALTMCGLNGSKISMNYDNNWSAREPMIQVINFYGNALPKPFGNVLFPTIFRPQSSNTLCMKVTMSIEKECVAIVLGFCAHEVMTQPSPHIFHYGVYNNSYCSMEARILRDGQEVYTCDLFAFRHNDPKDQIYLCTLRKHHQFVKSLQFGDQIGVFAQFGNDIQWAQIVIKEGAIIMVHGDDDDQIIVINSEVLSTRKSKDLRAAFLKLNLENNLEHNDHLYVVCKNSSLEAHECSFE
jgi:Leucine-rich repeat (LRR) protein